MLNGTSSMVLNVGGWTMGMLLVVLMLWVVIFVLVFDFIYGIFFCLMRFIINIENIYNRKVKYSWLYGLNLGVLIWRELYMGVLVILLVELV